MDLDVFSIQVSLAAPYPGTELYEMARQNGWFAKRKTRPTSCMRMVSSKAPWNIPA